MPEVQDNTVDNNDEKPEKPQKKTKSFPNKVVIRKLPPNLNEESFIEIVSPLPDHQDLYFCPADWSLGAEATSRAYIEFKNEEDIFIFKDKFDGYVFVDSVRGSDYAAIVEYAAFQGLPKSRARKKDKNVVGTIESEQHFLNFLDLMKQEEEAELKNEPKLEYSYQIKDDKKVTSTPLIEFLSAKNQEKRDFRRKKLDDKRKQRDDEKKNKKIQVAKNVPEPIKEVKEDAVYDDGIMVRTVPSRLGRNEKKKDSKGKVEPKLKSEDNVERDQERRDKERERRDKERREKDQERREKRDKGTEAKPKSEENAERHEKRENREKSEREARDTRRKAQKEKDDKRRMDRYEKSLQKAKEEAKPASGDPDNAKSAPGSSEKERKKEAPIRNETKRYSALRKARQEKTNEVKEPSDTQKQDEASADGEPQKTAIQDATADAEESSLKQEAPAPDPKFDSRKEARLKKIQERRAREADERAQRQIKNKDRPSMQIYQPKRRQENDLKPENMKSSDENSETSRKRSDNDRRRRSDRRPSRKNSKDETARKKKSSRSEDDAGDKPPSAGEGPQVSEEKEELVETFENLALSPPLESREPSKAEAACENPQTETVKESDDVQE